MNILCWQWMLSSLHFPWKIFDNVVVVECNCMYLTDDRKTQTLRIVWSLGGKENSIYLNPPPPWKIDLQSNLLGTWESKCISGVYRCTLLLSVSCNGHLQSGTGAGTAAGPVPRANGECRGPGRKAEGAATSDLFSEMNLTEIQKLKQHIMTVSLPSDQSCKIEAWITAWKWLRTVM